MDTALLLGELVLAMSVLGVIVRAVIDEVQELRLLAERERSISC
jgi:hypothetical protein